MTVSLCERLHAALICSGAGPRLAPVSPVRAGYWKLGPTFDMEIDYRELFERTAKCAKRSCEMGFCAALAQIANPRDSRRIIDLSYILAGEVHVS